MPCTPARVAPAAPPVHLADCTWPPPCSPGSLGLAALVAAPLPSAAVTIDWVAVGDPGNAADTPSTNCYARELRLGLVRVPDLEVRGHQRPVRGVPEREGGVGSARALQHEHGLRRDLRRHHAQRQSAEATAYSVKSGFADKPVVYVSFYDALRFANWLHNGQGSGDTETGAYTLLGGTATPSNGTDGHAQRRRLDLSDQRERVVQGGVLRRALGELLRLPDGHEHRDRLRRRRARTRGTRRTAGLRRPGGALTDVGAYSLSDSPYGTYDQGGNVWEWNEEIVYGSYRGIRGGSWDDDASDLAASSRTAHGPDVRGRRRRFPCRESDPRARHGAARDGGPARARGTAQALRGRPSDLWPWVPFPGPRGVSRTAPGQRGTRAGRASPST